MIDEYLRNIIKETLEEIQQDRIGNVNIRLASQLLNDPNNEVVWKVFPSENEDSMFSYGNSAEWFNTGEGNYHGTGVYCFYEPYGAQKRCGGAKIGNKIMKCIVRGGFKDFLILDGRMAMKYYKTDDIRTQLNYLYQDERLKNSILSVYTNVNGGSTKVHFNRTTGFLSKALFEKFGDKIRNGLTKGVVYNGSNDPHAVLVFNPRDVVPIAVTNEKVLNKSGNDFDGWKIRFTDELYNRICNEKDFFSYGEKLKAQGRIRSYSKIPPQNDCLFVTMPNGKQSAYNISLNKFVSEYGFDQCMGWETRKVMKNGEEYSFQVLPVVTDKKGFLLRYNPKGENYVFYNEGKTFKPYMSLKDYDLSHKQTLNEGSWGYEPLESDSALDFKGDIINNVFNECLEAVNGRYKGELISDKNTRATAQWDGIGNFMFFVEKLYKDFPIFNRDNEKWIKDCKQAFKDVRSNHGWIESWDKPEKMRKTIKEVEEEFDKLIKKAKEEW